MKKIMLLLLLANLPLHAQKQDVKKVIQDFFVAFHAQDTLRLRQFCTSKMILQSVSETEKGTRLTQESAQSFFLSIAKIPQTVRFKEQILNYTIQIDGAMAHVWTPYVFYVNNKQQHCGVNSFQLYKEAGRWKITYIMDTRRKRS